MFALDFLAKGERGDYSRIYNLEGGIISWDGHRLTGWPKVKILQDAGNLAEMLYLSMNMEKGAERFYKVISARFAETPFAGIIDLLAKAEVGHARLLYQLYRQESQSVVEFMELYESLSGDLLEGGQKLVDAINRLEGIDSGSPCLAVIELAFAVENSAYELYRNMADKYKNREEASLFYTIAQAEKEHIKLVSELLTICDDG